MPCYKPRYGWRSKYPNENGKFPVLWTPGPDCGERTATPCGQCIGCRLEYARVWGARLAHEVAFLEECFGIYSSFITLTYDEEHVPYGGTLVKPHLQDFFKRFRWHLAQEEPPREIRYYAAGEYGSTCPSHGVKDCTLCGPIQRPHYHAIILGFDFPDKKCLGYRDGYAVYESEFLAKLWKKGSHEIGSFSFDAGVYVASYMLAKFKGKEYDVADYYCKYLPAIDAWMDLEPEFATMSLKPGIGKDWMEKYVNDLYPHDQCPIPGRGTFGKPPKYYDSIYEISHPEELEAIKEERRNKYMEAMEDGPSLASKELVKKAQLDLGGRS